MTGGDTPSTSKEAYQQVLDEGEDVILRRRVAAALGDGSKTTHEIIQQFPEKSANAIRPRVNELIRMGCVERLGTRTNPSGHDAYVNHLTSRGERYALGEIEPTPSPPIAELKKEVVDTARAFLRGEAPEEDLRYAIMEHDDAKRRMDPGFDP